ncbi:hypothetical protein G4B88_024000 [Cannabis sativa]|uniref:Uncharacterized protein n=1 Tax=Cannabis sativa TaxID=3483 RepID=A0A7J6GKH5_CANSA|nr:hypothetical protein G4B88_024000 [Cannabis sativa]
MKPQAVSHSDYWTVVDEIGFRMGFLISLLPFSPELGTEGPGFGEMAAPFLDWNADIDKTLINSMLNTEEKRVKMTDQMRRGSDTGYGKELLFSYNIAVDRSEEMKRTLGKSAASVGLQLPEVYEP